MSDQLLQKPQSGILPLEEVQRMVAELEGKDRRLLPNLPGRIILHGSDSALTRSSDGEKFYRQTKALLGWSCACPAGAHGRDCWHVRTLERYLARAALNSPAQHPGDDPQRAEA